MKRSRSTILIKHLLVVFGLLLCLAIHGVSQESDFDISDHHEESYGNQQSDGYANSENAQRQMQYMSQRRTACLVLSRYYLNQYAESINGIVKDLNAQDQTKFINKLYATAVEKCQPIITQNEVVQFFTSTNQNFDPSEMFHIFDQYNFYQLTLNLDDLTQNQQAIIKFIKQFDAEMEVRKQQQEAQKNAQEADEGVQLFFISLKNLSPQVKYLYIVLVVLISGAILWYGFSQLEKKPEKKLKKKKQK